MLENIYNYGFDQFGNAQTEVLTAKAANETVIGEKYLLRFHL